MTIIRRRHNKNFTVIGNEVFSDESLDLDALGLLCYLRSRPNDWNISTEQLRRRFGCGPEKMQRLMRELIASGWILRQEIRKGSSGTFAGVEYVVLDEPGQDATAQGGAAKTRHSPESEKPIAVPESGKPESGEPESAEPESEKPTPYKELTLPNTDSTPPYPPGGGARSSEDRLSEREALAGRQPDRGNARRPRAERGYRGSALPAAAPDRATLARFERLWSAFPSSGRFTAARAEAIAFFAELAPAEQETAIRTAVSYAATCSEIRSQAKALHRWLRDGRWRNGELALATASGSPSAPTERVFVREGTPEWEAWAAHHRSAGKLMPMPTWSALNRADGWNFPTALPPDESCAA